MNWRRDSPGTDFGFCLTHCPLNKLSPLDVGLWTWMSLSATGRKDWLLSLNLAGKLNSVLATRQQSGVQASGQCDLTSHCPVHKTFKHVMPTGRCNGPLPRCRSGRSQSQNTRAWPATHDVAAYNQALVGIHLGAAWMSWLQAVSSKISINLKPSAKWPASLVA